MEYDNLETESGLTREAAAPSGESRGNQETGLQNPDQISSREKASTCVGRILTGVKELRRNSGLGETATAEPVGQMARWPETYVPRLWGCDFPI